MRSRGGMPNAERAPRKTKSDPERGNWGVFDNRGAAPRKQKKRRGVGIYCQRFFFSAIDFFVGQPEIGDSLEIQVRVFFVAWGGGVFLVSKFRFRCRGRDGINTMC